MKKLLALALCALLLVSLAACTRAPAADRSPNPSLPSPNLSSSPSPPRKKPTCRPPTL